MQRPDPATERTLCIFALLVAAYLLVALPAYVGPPLLETVGAYAVMLPLKSIYLLDHFGVPGLLQHGGHCGWWPCAPSVFGWIVMLLLWAGVFWLIARGATAVLRHRRAP